MKKAIMVKPEVHHAIKVQAAKRGLTIAEYMEQLAKEDTQNAKQQQTTTTTTKKA